MNPTRLIIEAGKSEEHYWADLWRYRELFYFISWRDVLVRYKQTAVGVAWAVVRPVLTTSVFVFVFGRLAKMPNEGVPYPLLVLAAMLPWQFFASALTEASASVVGNANMVSKIYFPRLIVPASAIIVALADFLISLVLLAVLMIAYGTLPTWRLLTLPIFTGVAMLAALGAGLWLAALNVEYRDFRYVLPFLVQFGLYLSPVGFSSSIVPDQWRLLYSLNPMVGVIDGFRWAITGAETPLYWPSVALALLCGAVLMGSGLWYFRRMERAFADVI